MFDPGAIVVVGNLSWRVVALNGDTIRLLPFPWAAPDSRPMFAASKDVTECLIEL
jgi:hypothetical protein